VADVENLPQSPIAENLTQQSVSTHIENDNTPQSHIDYDDSQMCSICILPLEHGDRIADLDCNHYYHSDCLSEWIKTKNTCPLCQQEGIAEEIRCYNLQSEDPNAVAADAFNVNAESDNTTLNEGERRNRFDTVRTFFRQRVVPLTLGVNENEWSPDY